MGKESEFFKGKRPWSLIKDQILKNYLTPYITKVAKLNKRIRIISKKVGKDPLIISYKKEMDIG